MNKIKRKGASKIADIPADILQQINRGEIETVNLMECLAIDFVQLMSVALPALLSAELTQMAQNSGLGWLGKTRLASQIIYKNFGADCIAQLLAHKSDNVRGWAAGVIALIPDLPIDQRLKMVLPLADDKNSGTRELAWILLRQHIANDVLLSIENFAEWVKNDSANIRRYAVEITRPRGVWCSHIAELKQNPELAIALLEPLKNDNSRYVQNSVANWLNDAAKTNAEWVLNLTEKWLAQSTSKETAYICKRARRNIV